MTYNYKTPQMRILRNLNMSYNRKRKYGWKLNKNPMFNHKTIQRIESIPELKGKILITINNKTSLVDMAVLSLSEIKEIKRYINEKNKNM